MLTTHRRDQRTRRQALFTLESLDERLVLSAAAGAAADAVIAHLEARLVRLEARHGARFARIEARLEARLARIEARRDPVAIPIAVSSSASAPAATSASSMTSDPVSTTTPTSTGSPSSGTVTTSPRPTTT